MENMKHKELVSVKTLTERFPEALAAPTLASLRVRGGGPPFYKIGSKILYDPEEYMDWLRAKRCTNTSEYPQKINDEV